MSLLLQKDDKIKDLERENAKLKEDAKNKFRGLLDMKSICEINIAEFRDEFKKAFDYFIDEKGLSYPWKGRPEKVPAKSKRVIGLLTVMHTVKIGIDLRDVLVFDDKKSGTVYYRMPKPIFTGLKDISPEWTIKAGLEYSSTLGWNRWSLVDDKAGKELEIFGKEMEEAVESISSGQYGLHPRIAYILNKQAQDRVQQMIRDMLHREAHQDDSISDDSPHLIDYISRQVLLT